MKPEEVAEVAELELRSHSHLQREIHYIPNKEGSKTRGMEDRIVDPFAPHKEASKARGVEDRIIEDPFVPHKENPINWTSSPQLMAFRGTMDRSVASFCTDYSYNRIFSIHVRLALPAVYVLKEFEDTTRIAWSPNVASNLLGCGRVIYGKQTIAEEYPVYAGDIERQFNCGKAGAQETELANIGSIPLLTDWSTSKPQFGPLYVRPRFHFTRDCSQCIRADLLEEKSQATMTFMSRLHHQAVRMQVRDDVDSPWRSVPCDSRKICFKEPIFGERREGQSTNFTAEGEVGVVDNEQREHELSCGDGFVTHFKHFKVLEKAHVGFGEVAEIEATHLNSICVALFILAFNERSAACNCWSNYTTNPDNPQVGANPIDHCEVFYADTLAKTFNAYYMEKLASERCPSRPVEPGYNMISFCVSDPFDPVSPHSLRGIVPSELKMKLRVSLIPYSQTLEGALKNDKFTVIVGAFVVRKLQYVKVEDGPDTAFTVALSEK